MQGRSPAPSPPMPFPAFANAEENNMKNRFSFIVLYPEKHGTLIEADMASSFRMALLRTFDGSSHGTIERLPAPLEGYSAMLSDDESGTKDERNINPYLTALMGRPFHGTAMVVKDTGDGGSLLTEEEAAGLIEGIIGCSGAAMDRLARERGYIADGNAYRWPIPERTGRGYGTSGNGDSGSEDDRYETEPF